MQLNTSDGDPAAPGKRFDAGRLLGHVDWTRAKAYALGLGSIYGNLLGRQRDGIVPPGPEYEQVGGSR